MPCSSCGQALPRFDCRSAYPTISEAVEVDARAVRERERAEQRDVVQHSNRPRWTVDGRLHAIWSEICLPDGGLSNLRIESRTKRECGRRALRSRGAILRMLLRDI
jgi:hypothetical protein